MEDREHAGQALILNGYNHYSDGTRLIIVWIHEKCDSKITATDEWGI